jgi:hypothetical protein
LSAILSSYTAETNPDTETANTVERFCVYAADWLSQNNVVGLGRAAAGVTLRFGDGRELSLFGLSDIAQQGNQPALSITGNSGSARPGVVQMTDSSQSITGNY